MVDACVIASQTITIPGGNTVSLTGARRLILLADEALTITGTKLRLLFSCEGKYSQVLLSLSIYEKRTQRAPTQEIELAEKRLKEWRAHSKN